MIFSKISLDKLTCFVSDLKNKSFSGYKLLIAVIISYNLIKVAEYCLYEPINYRSKGKYYAWSI